MEADVFLKASNNWSDKKETMSGSGSTIEHTSNIRRNLPKLLKEYNIKTMFDAPCGDGNWIKECDLGNTKYSGGDLVPKFVEVNPMPNVSVFDITIDTFPVVDLWMCRACLYHLSIEDITTAIDNFKNSNIKYALITSHTGKTGGDIVTGGFRRLNLAEYDYFGLGKPIDKFNDVLYNNMQEEMLLFGKY